MLRTTTHISNVWVPPPPQPPGHFKLVKTIVTTDLNTRHRHVQLQEDWSPEGASDEEKTAADKIAAMQPPRAFTTTIGHPLDETPEEHHARTTAGTPMDTPMDTSHSEAPPEFMAKLDLPPDDPDDPDDWEEPPPPRTAPRVSKLRADNPAAPDDPF